MEKTPIASGYGSTYGTVNPGYLPEPAISATPAQPGNALSAPLTNMFDAIPGYEGTVAGGYLPPPAPTVPMPIPEHVPVQDDWNIPSITEDAAHEVFLTYVSSKCCYRTGPAKDGVITAMEPFNTYRYRLETFTESRSTQLREEPYYDQPVDAFIQPAPQLWTIQVQTPSFFQKNKQNIRVPNTSSVKNCHMCLGMGRTQCIGCRGIGSKMCWVCNGSGACQNSRCLQCNSQRRIICSSCSGRGSRNCGTCNGRGQLLTYLNLKVKWSNNTEDYVVEQSSGLKVQKLRKVSGREIFKDTQCMLNPVLGFPDPAVLQASERLVRQHQAQISQSSRILQQRHTIELIPITRVSYTWKGKSHIFFVFGNEMSVKADDYPASCCCSVM